MVRETSRITLAGYGSGKGRNLEYEDHLPRLPADSEFEGSRSRYCGRSLARPPGLTCDTLAYLVGHR